MSITHFWQMTDIEPRGRVEKPQLCQNISAFSSFSLFFQPPLTDRRSCWKDPPSLWSLEHFKYCIEPLKTKVEDPSPDLKSTPWPVTSKTQLFFGDIFHIWDHVCLLTLPSTKVGRRLFVQSSRVSLTPTPFCPYSCQKCPRNLNSAANGAETLTPLAIYSWAAAVWSGKSGRRKTH